MAYICPLCRQLLQLTDKTWRCSNNHCFDCAKEGYVNLLPVQNKNSKDPGDNQQMMLARRQFLEAGFYQPLSDKVNQIACGLIKQNCQILDIGCGEGYYSNRLFEALNQQVDAQLVGLDISKSAIKYAAKKYKQLQFCVASAYDMPFEDHSIDLMLRIYAPSKLDEIKRVLKKEGYLITVSPAPKHHYAIKELIYEQPRLHPVSDAELDGFKLVEQLQLSWQLEMTDAAMIGHFLEMTPYAWKLTSDQKQQLMQDGLSCELDFQIEIHQLLN